jgi:hypothetical protein
MSDSGKVNFSKPNIKANQPANNKTNNSVAGETAANKENAIAKQVQKENKSVYKVSSSSQDQLMESANTNQQVKAETFINPIVAAQIKNLQKFNPKTKTKNLHQIHAPRLKEFLLILVRSKPLSQHVCSLFLILVKIQLNV